MIFELSADQREIQSLAREFARAEIEPNASEWDRAHGFPRELFGKLAELGFLGVCIPEEYGGAGADFLSYILVLEELSRADAGVGVTVAVHTSAVTLPILAFGSDEQRSRFVPPLARGEALGAFALTEPEAGSDAGSLRTAAVPDGDGWSITGTKQWITNGGEAEIYTIIAITDRSKGPRGASAFIVEKGMPGFTFGKKENKMGIRASATTELIFDNCRVPKENLIGKEGMGFLIAMKTLDNSRTGVGAQGVGVAQGAFEEAVKFARQRIQFGHPIITFQAIQHMLADMATSIEAARAFVYAVARFIDSGAKDVSKESAMSKVFATDVAMKVTTDAVQVMGGSGYMKEYPVEKMMRDAKILQIYEGTNQIQRNVIGQALIKEAARNKS